VKWMLCNTITAHHVARSMLHYNPLHSEVTTSLEGMPLTWLRTYLDGRSQYVKTGQQQSIVIQLRGQYWDPSCLPFTPVQLLTSLQATVFSTTSMLTTHSFALQCAPITHPPDCPFLPHVLPTQTVVVHAERPAAQPGQIRSTDYRNGTPATCCNINRVVRHCRWRRSAASQRNEGALCHPRLAPDFQGARISSCAIVQLPQPCHPPLSPSADDSTGTDAWL